MSLLEQQLKLCVPAALDGLLRLFAFIRQLYLEIFDAGLLLLDFLDTPLVVELRIRETFGQLCILSADCLQGRFGFFVNLLPCCKICLDSLQLAGALFLSSTNC